MRSATTTSSEAKSSMRKRRTTPNMAARRTIYRKRSHGRTMSWSDDYKDEPPARCRCQNCQMRGIHRQHFADVRDRNEMQLPAVLKAIGDQVELAISDLEELVKIQSVSVDPQYLQDSCMAMNWLADRLAALFFRTKLYPIDSDPLSCIEEPQQFVLFANYFSSPTKATVLIYAHVDVVPANRECWFNDPFQLHVTTGVLYGRGVSSGKGMLVGWLQAIECWLKVSQDLPINVKFIIEMMHEVGSKGIQQYVQEKSDFFADVDYMIFDTNSWLSTDRPVIACALTGWAHFGIDVRGAKKSVESGLSGGLVFEPMTDLCHLMNHLVDNNHEISIPSVDQMVKRLSTQDWHLLETADFSIYKYMDQLEIRRLRHENNKINLLQNRWCKPTISMHGVQGADHRSDCSHTLPMQVIGKFSIKLVPDMEVAQVFTCVRQYLARVSMELGMGTRMKVLLLDACDASSWSVNSRLTEAVMRAVGDVFQKEPIATSGIAANLPIASVLKKLIGKPIILVPYSMRMDNHHMENESIEEDLFMRHSKVCAALFYELSTLNVKCKCDVIFEYCRRQGVAERMAPARTEDVKSHRSLHHILEKQKQVIQRSRKRFGDLLCLPFKWRKMRNQNAGRKSGPGQSDSIS